MKLFKRKPKLFINVRETKRRSDVFIEMGFMPSLRENCPMEPQQGRWHPGTVYARGDERICIRCLSGWGAEHLERVKANPDDELISDLNIFNYVPRTMEEIGAALYPEGFSLLPPGMIVPL